MLHGSCHREQGCSPLNILIALNQELLVRVSPLLIVVLIACASPATPRTRTPEGVSVRVEGNRTALSVNAVPVAGVSLVGAGIEKAWQVLPAVYDSLPIARTIFDPATHTIGTEGLQIRRRLGNVRLSKYLDCGVAQQGSSADSYDVNLTVTTQLTAEPTGATKVTTTVSAMAKPMMLSGEYSRCSSTGEIELRVHKLLDAAVMR